MAVLRPLRLVVDNWPEPAYSRISTPAIIPAIPGAGTRKVPFGRELLDRARGLHGGSRRQGFRRLAPGREVRLRYAYIVRCEWFETDPATGAVSTVHCTHDAGEPRRKRAPDGRKIPGTIHWVAAERAETAVLRLYDRLYLVPDPDRTGGPQSPASLEVDRRRPHRAVPRRRPAGERFQFERLGYFCRDDDLGFNRTVTLRDGWARNRAG